MQRYQYEHRFLRTNTELRDLRRSEQTLTLLGGMRSSDLLEKEDYAAMSMCRHRRK